ncbi:hypothetical protein LOK49_LG13G02174 [Camellia lanceoleosa]|uniref:Uncharacterized protein n=1 Tax=Camellia lanceoleosa TaxID=1840588 RepID=A0ACC0FMD5_9ERIC|nr:hypothetical protein LOK49_LG13G02174 [Camellia lanceoleosa]
MRINLTQWSGATPPLQEVSSMLLEKLVAAGIGSRPVVFVTHSGHPPSKPEIEDLERQCNGIPLKFCHVEYGRVSFFSFNRVELLVLP